MRVGDCLALNCNNLNLDFKDVWTDELYLPMDEITDYELWRDRKYHTKIVRPEENVDLLNNKGCFGMGKNFTIAFLYRFTSNEDMVRIVDNIPNSDQMQILIVESTENSTVRVTPEERANDPVARPTEAVSAVDYLLNASDSDRHEPGEHAAQY